MRDAQTANKTEYYSLYELANLLKACPRTIKTRADAGEIPHVKNPITGKYHFPKDKIEFSYAKFFRQLEAI